MATLTGFLGALADAATPGTPPSYLTQVSQLANPEETALANYHAQMANSQQQQNQMRTNALAAIVAAQKGGVTNPTQLFGAAATANPEYLKDYATMAASNPLGFALSQPQSQGNTQPAQQLGAEQQAPASSPAQQQPIASLSGQELLKALPPQIASTIKSYSEGRIPFNARLAATPQGQTLLSLITQYDPTFDTADPASRAATRKSFTSGPDANNITALNTAMGHAASLKEAYDKLRNGDYPTLNYVENYLSKETGDKKVQSALSDVSAKSTALASELAKVFRSTGMSQKEIDDWQAKLSPNATPSEQKATLNAAMELMDSRLSALAEKYNQGLGQSKQGIELLSPEAQKAYQAVRGEQSPTAAPVNVGGQSKSPTASAASIATPSLGHLSDEQLLAIAKSKKSK